MLVTTARIGDSFRNERSLSSASATRYCDLPSRALEPMASTRPPTTTVGSRSAGGEHRGDHGRRGGLAVHAGNGDAIFQAHQLGQHLGALDHRDVLLVRGDDLGIVARDGRADDDDFRAR